MTSITTTITQAELAASPWKHRTLGSVTILLDNGRAISFAAAIGLDARNRVYLEVDDMSRPTGHATSLRFRSHLVNRKS